MALLPPPIHRVAAGGRTALRHPDRVAGVWLDCLLFNHVVALPAVPPGAIVGRTPLNVLQLLWVNLIMDTMAALALATEKPHPALLD